MNLDLNITYSSTYVLQELNLSHTSGKLEDLDKDVQKYEADVKHTLCFVLQGEEFFISACELRDLLRARGTPVYQLSSAFASPALWGDVSKETYDVHCGRVGWLTRILYAKRSASIEVDHE
ncbi:MAG: hypothetical protein [Caudoviricetes sp.]|nr:MAG: hypothetical protein [Caudoviricetes sp.]